MSLIKALKNFTTLPYLCILVVYFVLALGTLFAWRAVGVNGVIGDEPHYLVMASGWARHGVLEQTLPYRDEFQNQEIYPGGWVPRDSVPTPEITHALQGPRGLYNIHNIGLPLLLSAPFGMGGVLGAKLFMILLGSFAVAVSWRLIGYFTRNHSVQFLCAASLCWAMPLVPAANQIYPDLLAGTILLYCLPHVMWTELRPDLRQTIWMALLLSFLPWLQVKYALPALIVMAALVVQSLQREQLAKRVIAIIAIAIVCIVPLAIYNNHAFGKLTGPYNGLGFEINRTSLMVCLGLFIDQNQGFLMQNPIHWVGVAAVGMQLVRHPKRTLLWAAVFLSLLLPNAMHPNWYGGQSFSGRFGWAATLVFWIPTLAGLTALAENQRRVFKGIISASLLLQATWMMLIMTDAVELYNRSVHTHLSSYSMLNEPIHAILPALYNVTWAYRYPPNWVWAFILICVFAVGVRWGKTHPAKTPDLASQPA